MPVRRSIFLITAFAALFAVVILAGLAVWRNAREAQVATSELQQRELRAYEALSDIRSGVYLTAILTRDYLLDSDPAHAQDYVEQFTAIRTRAKRGYDTLDAGAQSEVKDALRRLWTEMEAYWDTTRVMLQWSPEEKRAHRLDMLRLRVRRREEIFALATQIEQLNAQNSAQERERVEHADSEFRASLAWIAGAALLLGLGIAGFTVMRMQKLESQSLVAESELRLLSGQIRTAQEQERKYLSRELHDQVGQMLTGLRMELTALSRLTVLDKEGELRMAHAKATVEQTLGIVRNIAMLLRPSMLDDLGLTPALTWLVKEMSQSSGMDIRSTVDSQVDSLPDAHRTCLFRVVQEALTNASKHSGARKVDIRVGASGGWVQASIADDGKGFEPGTEKRKGLGLVGMEERVREMGGTLRVTSAPGRGTAVEIRLPQPVMMEGGDDQDSDFGRSRDRSDRIKAAL